MLSHVFVSTDVGGAYAWTLLQLSETETWKVGCLPWAGHQQVLFQY